MIQRGLNKLNNCYERYLRCGLSKIKEFNFMGNSWREKWVRNLVYRTPANLQTSLWRLQNYANNQKKLYGKCQ